MRSTAAGSLYLEFATLSRLTGDCAFEASALSALDTLLSMRTDVGLLGKNLDMVELHWLGESGGIGAGADSFYEILLKGYVLTGEPRLWTWFEETYAAALRGFKAGGSGWYHDANIALGVPLYPQFNALMAFWPGMQVLAGDVRLAAQVR
jgi:hypothetical protein